MMHTITLFGAGRSSSSLIKYLLEKSTERNFRLVVADQDIEVVQNKIGNHLNAEAVAFSLENTELRERLIEASDIVISMLPASLHIDIAKDCVKFGKNLVTASYISEEMRKLNDEVVEKGLVFMNECGLDPGIDHMSAMKVIDEIKGAGYKPTFFESFCGGLVAPESDTNSWNYKFSWNPRNVVVAGQGGAAKFLQEGTYKYIPYQRLFKRTEFLDVEGYGRFEAYANRDSLSYRKIYGLEDAHTIYRGTIRRVGYSRAWDKFVQLGLTDDTYTIEDSENMTYRDFINSFLYYHPSDSVEVKFRLTLNIQQDDTMWEKFEELELFSDEKKIGLKNATPARILEKILSDKWKLQPEDKDMIVMYHKFGYTKLNSNEEHEIHSTMVCLGDDSVHTAMAKTVGLPVAIIALQILEGKIVTPGVQLPIKKEVYMPVLEELEWYGIVFNEKKIN